MVINRSWIPVHLGLQGFCTGICMILFLSLECPHYCCLLSVGTAFQVGWSEVADKDNMKILEVVFSKGSQCLHRKAGAADTRCLISVSRKCESSVLCYTKALAWCRKHGIWQEGVAAKGVTAAGRGMASIHSILPCILHLCLKYVCISKHSRLYTGSSCPD